MKKNPLNKGIIMENAAGIGTVTSEMVESRARELAAINGRPSSEPSEADYQQAKHELTGEAEIDPQEESRESEGDSTARGGGLTSREQIALVYKMGAETLGLFHVLPTLASARYAFLNSSHQQ